MVGDALDRYVIYIYFDEDIGYLKNTDKTLKQYRSVGDEQVDGA